MIWQLCAEYAKAGKNMVEEIIESTVRYAVYGKRYRQNTLLARRNRKQVGKKDCVFNLIRSS